MPMAPSVQPCNSPSSLYIYHIYHLCNRAIVHLLCTYGNINATVQFSIFFAPMAPCTQPANSPTVHHLYTYGTNLCSRAILHLLYAYSAIHAACNSQSSLYLCHHQCMLQPCNSPSSLCMWYHPFSCAILHLLYTTGTIIAAVHNMLPCIHTNYSNEEDKNSPLS